MFKIFKRRSFRSFLLGSLAVLSLANTSLLFADGLPGEYYVTQRWRTIMASHSPAVNPSYLMNENYSTLRFAIAPTLQASFLLMEAGYTQPFGLYHTFGFTYLGVTTSEEFEATKWENGAIVNTGETFKDNHSLFVLSWAMNPWNKLNIGANANIYYDANFGDPLLGLSLDVGLSYRLLQHSLLGDHLVGVTWQNVISPAFTGNGVGVNNNSDNIKLSWNAKLWEKRIDFGIDVDMKDILTQATNAAEEIVSGDVKNAFEFDFNARLGFWFLRVINPYFVVGNEYIGGALGFNAPVVNGGRDFQVLYQYIKILNDESITSSHTGYARLDIGRHREEVYARKMAKKALVGPGDLYNRARKQYADGNYWEAFFLFGRILTEYPDFFKNDWVRLFLGLCQENMDMREFSMENFNTTKKEYPRSVVVPYSDLGLMRLNYREGNSSGVENQFALLNRATVPDSLKFHSYYYMGQTHIKEGRYQQAIQVLGLIPEGHPEFMFAQHSLGIAHALADNLPMSIEVLDNVIQSIPTTEEQKEIINRSYLLLGYIYYEGINGQERSLSKAVSALRKVPETSLYFEDALLGLSWTALKASQWVDCIASAQRLRAVTQKPVNKAESQLLEAYCYMMDKKWGQAYNLLKSASGDLDGMAVPTDSELNTQSLNYDNDRGTYYEVAQKANELALSSQSSFVIAQIDSLKLSQVETQKKLTDFYKFKDEFARRSFFARNIEQVSNDVEYALAKTEKNHTAGDTKGIMDDAIKDAKKVEEEMRKVEEELKKLQEEESKETQDGQ